MSFARKVADRVVFMEQGRIVEIAPPETFFTNPATDRAWPSSIPPRADAAACPPEPSTRVLPMRHDPRPAPEPDPAPNAGPGLDTGPNPGPNPTPPPQPLPRATVQALTAPPIRQLANAAMHRRRAALLVRRIRQPDRGRHPRGRQPVAGAGETRYGENLGRPYLRHALSCYLSALHGVDIGTERIAVSGSGYRASCWPRSCCSSRATASSPSPRYGPT